MILVALIVLAAMTFGSEIVDESRDYAASYRRSLKVLTRCNVALSSATLATLVSPWSAL